MKFKSLFEPIRIRNLELKNRIIMPPMATHYATREGEVTERMIAYYAERAKGGVGLIITESAAIHPEGRGGPNRLSIYDDKFIPGLKRLVKAIHEYDAKTAAQLHHGGGQIDPKNIHSYPSAAYSVPYYSGVTPRTLTIEEIKELELMFAEGARRAKEAGYDAVQIHAAHGYLIWSFLSPLTNKREDEYGGDIDGRMRFLLEIIREVRKKVEDLPIMVRINASDYVDGGIDIEQAKIIAQKLEKAGVDSIHVSAAIRESHEYQVPPRAIPRGVNVSLAAEIKKVVKIPVAVAGRIDKPDLANKIIEDGLVDLVEVGRALIADPEWPRKAYEGRTDEIKPCIACITCDDRLFADLDVACAINPFAGYEWKYRIEKARDKKKVLIIGGGPAGMEAALIAKKRGHDVILIEKEKNLGGQLKLAAVPPFKDEIKELIEYYDRMLRKLGVDVKLGIEASLELVEEMNPDVVIVATGAIPLIPKIPGVDKKNVITAHDLLAGKVKVEDEKIVIVGGGLVGCETADYLIKQGIKKISIVEMLDDLGMMLEEVKGSNEKLLLRRLLVNGVKIYVKTKVEEIVDKGVIARRGDKRELIEADTIILAVGARPCNSLVEQLRNKVKELYVIGDCVEPRKIINATHEAREVATRI